MAPGCPTVGIWLGPAERWLLVLLSSSRTKGWEDADQQRGRSVAGGVEPAGATPAPARCWVSSDGPFLPLAVWQQQLLFPDHHVSVRAGADPCAGSPSHPGHCAARTPQRPPQPGEGWRALRSGWSTQTLLGDKTLLAKG